MDEPKLDDIIIQLNMLESQVHKIGEMLSWVIDLGIDEARKRVQTELKAMNTFTYRTKE